MIPVVGGLASFAEEGSPYNKVAGLGFGGVPSGAALSEIERAFTVHGAPVQIEIAHLVNPAIGALLTERGNLQFAGDVLHRALSQQRAAGGGWYPVLPWLASPDYVQLATDPDLFDYLRRIQDTIRARLTEWCATLA
ncbi:MAG: hypothetical protein QOJ30_4687 [Pseudonocardiales bacterium]|nr:hypothetical protein [Pseudonocardiales bacterium]